MKDELDFALNEVERIKSESEIMIDEETKRINQSKQAEMEKNIEILRLENEQKNKKIRARSCKKDSVRAKKI